MTDRQDLEQIASGDHAAFYRVFIRYHGQVSRYISYLVKDGEQAADLTQEVFIKVWTYRESLPLVRSFDSYLYQIARNAVKDHIRSQTARSAHTLAYSARQQSYTAFEEEFIARESEHIIRDIVTQMPEARRRVFEMSRYQGLRNEEIAQQLNISKKTVENHLNAALRDIRKLLPALIAIAYALGF